MRCADPGANYASWRDAARRLLQDKVPPHDVLWESADGLFSAPEAREEAPVAAQLKEPSAFVEMAESVACHRDPSRWSLLYQILWRVV